MFCSTRAGGQEAATAAGYTAHIRRGGEEQKACDASKGHKPRRWVVERTFAWLGRYRRLAKDYEYLPVTSENTGYLAMTLTFARRLARAPT